MKTLTFTALSFLILMSPASAQQPLPPPPAAAATPTAGVANPNARTETASTSPANTSPDYRLTSGDKLRIDVYKDQQLSQSLQIRPDGKITLPLVGDVPAAGKTAMQLRDDISSDLKEYIANPVVTVIVLETAPQVVYVMGEVAKPGTLPIVGGRLTILQALAMAGGFTDFANRKDIRVIRKAASGMQTLKFNYKDAVDEGREPMLLQPGDTVIVR